MTRILPVVALLLTACAGNPTPPPPPAGPLPPPESAERMGILAEAAAVRAGAVLYDGGACIELRDGRALWTFGDTFFGDRGSPANPDLVKFFGPAGAGDRLKSIRGAVSHTALRSSRADFSGAEPDAAYFGEHAPLIPLPPEEADPESLRLWPMHGIHAGPVNVFYAVVRVLKDAKPPFNFEVLGIGLAVGDADRPPFTPWRDSHGWRIVAKDGPGYGAAVLQADMGITDGFDYIYGTKSDGVANRVFLARVPHGKESDSASWYYRCEGAQEWSPDPSRAVPLFDDAPGDLSVSWNPHLKKFLAVHSRVLSREVVARVSNRPEGPWSAPTVLFTVPPPATGDTGFVYAGKEQIGLRSVDGRSIFVSAVDSREGVPAVWRVELAR